MTLRFSFLAKAIYQPVRKLSAVGAQVNNKRPRIEQRRQERAVAKAIDGHSVAKKPLKKNYLSI